MDEKIETNTETATAGINPGFLNPQTIPDTMSNPQFSPDIKEDKDIKPIVGTVKVRVKPKKSSYFLGCERRHLQNSIQDRRARNKAAKLSRKRNWR